MRFWHFLFGHPDVVLDWPHGVYVCSCGKTGTGLHGDRKTQRVRFSREPRRQGFREWLE